MLSDKSTVCPNNLLDLAHQKKGIKVAIANAGKKDTADDFSNGCSKRKTDCTSFNW